MRTFRFGRAARLTTALGMAAMMCSCAVTTASLEGTSETAENTSETSTDFTSSTSPRDDSARKDEKTLSFARANMDRLKSDIALGGGEHLASLGSLLGVAATRQGEFSSFARERFDALFGSDRTAPEDFLARLDRELATRPQLRN